MATAFTDYGFCSCANLRVGRDLHAFIAKYLESTGLNLPAGQPVPESVMREIHIAFLRETAARCPGGSNKGRCVHGCQPTFERETRDYLENAASPPQEPART